MTGEADQPNALGGRSDLVAQQLVRGKVNEILSSYREGLVEDGNSPTPTFVTTAYFLRHYGVNFSVTNFLLADVSQEIGISKYKRPITKYSLKEALPIIDWYTGLPRVNEESGRFIDEKDDVWLNVRAFTENYSIGASSVSRALQDQTVDYRLGIRRKGHFALLYHEQQLQELTSKLLSVPQVDRDTSLYLDENNNSWTYPRSFLSSFPQLTENTIHSLISRGLNGIPGRDVTGHVTTLFPAAEARSLLEEFVNLPQVDKETGIYIDPETNRIFAPVIELRRKYGLADGTIIRFSDKVSQIRGRDRINHVTDFYDQEAFAETVAQYLSLQQANGDSGEITDTEGTKWVYRKALLRNYPVGKGALNTLLRDIPFIQGRASQGLVVPFYKLADVEERIRAYLSLPKPEREVGVLHLNGTDWYDITYLTVHFRITRMKLRPKLTALPKITMPGRMNKFVSYYDIQSIVDYLEEYSCLPIVDKDSGTYTDDKDEAWATITNLQRKYGLTTLPTLLKGVSVIKGVESGKEVTLYNQRESEVILSPIVSLPQVDKTSNRYTDESENNWTTIQSICDRYGVGWTFLANRIVNLPHISGRDKGGHMVSLYKEEEVLALLEQDGYFDKERHSNKESKALSSDEANEQLERLLEE